MAETVRVEGLAELRKALISTIPEEMDDKVMQQALTAAAQPILRDAKARVPTKTGRLRRAIASRKDSKHSTRNYHQRQVYVKAGKKYGARDAYYWKWVELGRGEVRAKGKKGARILANRETGEVFGTRVKAVPAKPFMRPAFQAQKGAAVEKMRTRLKTAIQNAAEKARWRTPRQR